MGCSYSGEELKKYEGIGNAIGEPCRNCDELHCEHNENEELFKKEERAEEEELEHEVKANSP